MTEIGFHSFRGCTELTSIVVSKENTKYDSRNNSNAIINTEMNCIAHGFVATIIPDTVTWIGKDAFSGCVGLKSIVIPDSVTYIGNRAFQGCTSLKSIVIPDSVTNIGYEVFEDCTNL